MLCITQTPLVYIEFLILQLFQVMEQSPGSSSNGGPVASDSGSSLHSKMATVSNISTTGVSTQNAAPVQFNPATLVAAVNQTTMNVSSSTYNTQSLMNLQPFLAKPVPGIIPALNSQSQDASKAHFILPGGTSVLQIQQNGIIKTATINPSQSLCSTVLQSSGHQQVTNVSYSGELVGSLPSNMFIKPENESAATCSKSVVRGNTPQVCHPVVMPRGMMTNIAPSQGSMPHPPVMGNTMSALNFKLPPPTPQTSLFTGSDQIMLPTVPTSVPIVSNTTPTPSNQFVQPNSANSSAASQSQVCITHLV